ncbi:MAG: SufE family protein [Bdellovibrionales bacterium]
MSLLLDRQKKIVAEFSGLSNWEDRYKKLIELGKALPDLPDEKKLEDYKVKGCQSQVWFHAKLVDGKVIFEADSDALLVRGLVALLLRIYSDATPDEILVTPPDFVKEIGLESKLSPSRANGLFSMIKQIKYYAMAFQAMK